MTREKQSTLTLIERIERALVLLAYLMERDGDVHLPMFEKFEAELAELKRAETARDRARRLLQSYSREGGLKAIERQKLELKFKRRTVPVFGFARAMTHQAVNKAIFCLDRN